MKVGEEKDMTFGLRVKKTHLGRLNAGTPFVYKSKLWVILNRADGGGKLIRTLVGDSHETAVKPSNTIVRHVVGSKKTR